MGDFLCDKGFIVMWWFVIEEDFIDGEYVVWFLIVVGGVKGECFGISVRVLWVEWCGFILWCFYNFFVEFWGRGLIKFGVEIEFLYGF